MGVGGCGVNGKAVRTAEVVVIGAGVNGAATAFSLVQKGMRDVLLIERRGIASGPTGVSSAIIRQHYGHEVTARMALDSLKFFQRFDEITGGHAEFKTCGVLVVAPEKQLPTVRACVEMQQRVGIRTGMIDLEELERLEPDVMVDDLAGAAWEPDAGYADPVGTTAGFVHWATEHGATAWFDTAVDGLLIEGGRIVGVMTPRGRVSTDRVVLAAGPWAAPLALGAATSLPIRASRHPVLVYRRPDGSRPKHILFDVGQRMYLRPEGTNLILVGSLDIAHAENDADPDDFETQPNFDEISEWGQMLLTRFPKYDDVETRRGWCGIYEFTPDWHHIMDELPTARGCFVVCGTSGHGFKLGPACGDIMSDLVLGQTPGYDLTDFRLDRFATGHAIQNTYSETIIG